MIEKKFKLAEKSDMMVQILDEENRIIDRRPVFRIIALRDIIDSNGNVLAKKGDMGGYVEAEYNDYENKPFLKVTCAGLPDKARRNVTFENFNYGSKYEGKLIPKRYPGGIILTPQTFEIKC